MIYLFLLNIISITIIFLVKNKNLIESCLYSFIVFLMEYITLTMVYFVFDNFNIFIILMNQLIINLLWVFLLKIRKKKTKGFEIGLKENYIPIIIMIIMFLIIGRPYGFFGMGQDEGVYETHAILLMNGESKLEHTFEEYDLLDDIEKNEYDLFRDNNLIGFDRNDSEKPYLENANQAGNSGRFHGIYTFAAILALWGKLFGLTHMLDIQIIIYAVGIYFFFKICKKMKLSDEKSIFGTVLYAMSPIILWVSQSALTEVFISLLILIYLHALLESEKEWYSTIPIGIFSIFHVSIYTMMPLFYSVYIVMYILRKNYKYLINIIIITIFFLLGMFSMFFISPVYSFNNWKPFTEKIGILNDSNLRQFILISCTLVIILTIILLKYYSKVLEIIYKEKIKLIIIKTIKIIVCLGLIISIFIQMLIIIKNIQNRDFVGAIQYSSLVAISFVSSVLILPVIYFQLLKNINKYILNEKFILILVLFGYCIVFYCSFLRTSIDHYYYYSRYFAPYIAIIYFMYLLCMEQKIVRKKIHVFIGIFSLCISLPYIYTVVKGMDDTRMTWDNLENVIEEVQKSEAEIVIIDNSLCKILYLPIRASTDKLVYPALNSLDMHYEEWLNDNKEILKIQISEQQEVKKSEFVIEVTESQDLNGYRKGISPLPLKFEKKQYNIEGISSSSREQWYQSISTKNIEDLNDVLGFSNLEKNFRWINSKTATIKCYIPPKTKKIVIEQGALMPEEIIKDGYRIDIYLNEQYLKVDCQHFFRQLF